MGKKSIQIVGDDATELDGETFMPVSTETESTEQESPAAEETKATPKRLPVAGNAEPIDQDTGGEDEQKLEPAVPTTQKQDLTSNPDFRAWQAKIDKQVQDERSKREAAERQLEEFQRNQTNARLAYLEGTLDSDSFTDVDARRHAVEEYAQLKGWKYYNDHLAWNSLMRQRITEEGLDPADPRFAKRYEGEKGAAEFEHDVLTAAKEKLIKEKEMLMAQLNPENISKLVKQEMAKAAHSSGLDFVDTGESTTPVRAGVDDMEHDIDELNHRRMSPDAFVKKWGKPI